VDAVIPASELERLRSARAVLVRRSAAAVRALPARSRNRLRAALFSVRPYWPWELIVEPGDTVVQVGVYSPRTLARLLQASGPSGRVVAVEPVTATYRRLAAATRSHPLAGSLSLVNKCAFSSRQPMEMRLAGAAGNRPAGNKLVALDTALEYPADRTATAERTEMVEADTLDSILSEEGVDAVDTLIVTVNGAEVEVLKGAAATLRAMPPGARAFVTAFALKPSGETIYGDVERLLSAAAFSVTRTRRSPSVTADAVSTHRQGDAFGFKPALPVSG
jgi:FkbM family methyltransferase